MVLKSCKAHRLSNLEIEIVSTIEVRITRSIDGLDIFDVFGCTLVTGSFELIFALWPVGIFIDL